MGTGLTRTERMSELKSVTPRPFQGFMNPHQSPSWLKNRGYLHITPQIDVYASRKEILSKIKNKNYVAKYAFFPLIHASIDERRYKAHPDTGERCHSYQDKNGEFKKQIKSRPLHYATHMDALILGYYAEILQNKYEKFLAANPSLSDCIIAYRKIPYEESGKNKSTIHFAHEVFEEIKNRGKEGDCMVLTFDIKSFFSSLNHQLLKKVWADLINEDKLPEDHFNVFKAVTRFSYILLDDLRIADRKTERKAGFDEKKLAKIRNKYGIHSFFESAEEFRNTIKNRKLRIHRFPFRDTEKQPMGIPQGLPISAVLANLYLLNFDKQIFSQIVHGLGGFYRRYSDDMVIICHPQYAEQVKLIVTQEIENSLIKISKEKTETFLFTSKSFGSQPPRLTGIKITDSGYKIAVPFTYLGFEFYGSKTLIKSANLAKFYRRMISTVKRKSKQAIKIAEQQGHPKPIIFKRRLFKLYKSANLNKTKVFMRRKSFELNHVGEFRLKSEEKAKDLRSNYFSYVNRANRIMKEDSIKIQIRNHKKLFNQALQRHLKKKGQFYVS